MNHILEWSTRPGTGTSVILMRRWCNEEGKDSKGNEVMWTDVATIHTYNDVEQILRALRKESNADTT